MFLMYSLIKEKTAKITYWDFRMETQAGLTTSSVANSGYRRLTSTKFTVVCVNHVRAAVSMGIPIGIPIGVMGMGTVMNSHGPVGILGNFEWM